MLINYKFSQDEIKKIMKNAVILIDSREQQNQHILDYFNDKNIKYEIKKLDHGDYSIKLDPLPEHQIHRPLYIPVVIEKKNSVDELAQSFKDRSRFEHEFIRSKGNDTKMYLLIEDGEGYGNILKHKYRSQYEPKALINSLKSWEAKYDLRVVFENKDLVADWIYRTLYFWLRDYLIK